MKHLKANLRMTNQSDFGSFIQNRYKLFIKRFTDEITEAFEQLDFCFPSLFLIQVSFQWM